MEQPNGLLDTFWTTILAQEDEQEPTLHSPFVSQPVYRSCAEPLVVPQESYLVYGDRVCLLSNPYDVRCHWRRFKLDYIPVHGHAFFDGLCLVVGVLMLYWLLASKRRRRRQDTRLRWFHRLVLYFIKLGPIPQHVAFIMDGNRRFARKRSQATLQGHEAGFKQLEHTLEWSLYCGIRCVTVYAFSIENFKRSPQEVDGLMQLASDKLMEFATHSEFIERHGIRVRVLGQLDLLPSHVYKAAIKVMENTRHHSNAILNICMPYTSRHEIAMACRHIAQQVKSGELNIHDIQGHHIQSSLFTSQTHPYEYTKPSDYTLETFPPLDILVRTSGEIRLSDFMLAQAASDCQIHFLDVLWPDFSVWDMIPILFAYQKQYYNII